jgi:hypothetical protein
MNCGKEKHLVVMLRFLGRRIMIVARPLRTFLIVMAMMHTIRHGGLLRYQELMKWRKGAGKIRR